MDRQIPTSTATKIDEDQIRIIVSELGWDKQLVYDHNLKRGILNGEDIPYVVLAERIKKQYNAKFNEKLLFSILSATAWENNPTPNQDDPLLELVSEYVSDKAEVTIREILEAHKDRRGFDIQNHSLQIRIAKALKSLDYEVRVKKIDRKTHRVWVATKITPAPVNNSTEVDELIKDIEKII